MASKPKTTLLLNDYTQATKKKSSLNYVYKVKGIQCHSNHSLQQLELEKKATKTSSIIYTFSL